MKVQTMRPTRYQAAQAVRRDPGLGCEVSCFDQFIPCTWEMEIAWLVLTTDSDLVHDIRLDDQELRFTPKYYKARTML